MSRTATALSRYHPPCNCARSAFGCGMHRRLRPGEALYMVAGEPARFGPPWRSTKLFARNFSNLPGPRA